MSLLRGAWSDETVAIVQVLRRRAPRSGKTVPGSSRGLALGLDQDGDLTNQRDGVGFFVPDVPGADPSGTASSHRSESRETAYLAWRFGLDYNLFPARVLRRNRSRIPVPDLFCRAVCFAGADSTRT